jgi:MFS family permease
VLAAAILQGGASMIGPASPIWLVRHLGAPTSFLGTVSLASSLTAIASQRLWARWIERWGADRTLGYAATAAAFIPLGWMLVWQPWIALLVSAYGGLAWGGYSLAMTSRLLQLAPESERPVYLGTYAAAIGASTAIGSLVAGLITQAVPIEWVPLIFLASFLVRGLGMLGLRRNAATRP